MEIGSTIIILVLIGIASYLAFRFHKADRKAGDADKLSAYLAPITLANTQEMLERKGYKIEDVDGADRSITFSINDIRFNLDIGRQPITFLNLGYAHAEDIDVAVLSEAAEKVTKDIIMVKVGVHDDGYNFLITCCANCIGHLEGSLDKYMDILDDAQKRLAETYHEYIEKKRGRCQDHIEIMPEDGVDSQTAKMVS